MADQKISQLPAASTTSGSDLYTLVQGGANKSITFVALQSALGAGGGVTSLNGLTGALNVVPGSNISVTPSGSSITIGSTAAPGANTTLSNLVAGTSTITISTSAPVTIQSVGASALQFLSDGSMTLTSNTGGNLQYATNGQAQLTSGNGNILRLDGNDNDVILGNSVGSTLEITNSNHVVLSSALGGVFTVANDITLAPLSGHAIIATAPINFISGQVTYNGSVSGSAAWSMPFQGPTYKKFCINLNALSDAGTTINYPVGFVPQPYLYGDAAAIAVCSTTNATFTIAPTAGVTGSVFVEGY